ncbi:MAG: HAMP domain-containing sensor histidine kinase [Jannaschia sp.]
MRLPAIAHHMARLPLSLRVPLLAAGFMVLVGIVASQTVLSMVGRLQDDRLRELVRLQVEGLSIALGPAVQRRDVWEAFDVLDRTASTLDSPLLAQTVVADDTGRVLAATGPRAAPVDSEFARLTEGAQSLEAVRMPAGAKLVRILTPLMHQGREVGQVLSEVDVSGLAADRARLMRLLLLGNALATGLLALAGYAAVRRTLRPIRLLARHMEKTEGRPIPIGVGETRDAETDRLIRIHDAMAEAVAARVEAERRLAERERYVSLGRLSSSLAHEINNPLGGLLNAVDTVRAYADRPEVVRDSAALLDRGLRHLQGVAGAILDQHRPGAVGQLGSADLDDLRLLVTPEIERRDQSLDWSVTAGREALARVPAAPVRQVALNLLLNGSGAAGPGGRVRLELCEEAGGLRLAISDSGPGLSDAVLRRLLTLEESETGGGMGLRSVRDLVAGLGGRIEHVRPAGLTEIVVRLPATGVV